MKRGIFLTSIIAIGFAYPAIAEPVVESQYPTDRMMQENTTYTGAATYTNFGEYEGTVTATAEYEDIIYKIAAGTYLPAGSVDAVACPAGSFCAGVTSATYSETDNQGISTCPSGYSNSDQGATSNTQCYTACAVGKVAHATAVSGNDYYNTDADTCSATECEGGYHTNEETRIVEKTPLIDVDYREGGKGRYGYGYIGASGNTGTGLAGGLTENNTWVAEFDYGNVYGRASCQSAPHDAGSVYVMENVEAVVGGTKPLEEFRSELTEISGASKANYISDVAAKMMDGTYDWETGVGEVFKAIHVVFAVDTSAQYSTTDTGQYCYCQMTDFTPTGGVKAAVLSAPWVFFADIASASYCAMDCAYDCAFNLHNGGPSNIWFRAAVFGSFGALSSATCQGNEITIEWSDADPADIEANNAGMCIYGGDITTPVKAKSKPGKTFKGWKFEKQGAV
ncbi:MAG: hypothetical protein J6R22_03780 [Alphaproteobacteria bacterium]|nr:hypothetical protein [Alphaproteobacteria bacterium]